jgi:hypothetical protein
MGVVRLKYRMHILERTTPTLTHPLRRAPLQGGGDKYHGKAASYLI